MSTAAVTSKGQITIPATVPATLGLKTGSRVEFVETESGDFTIIAATSPISALKGILRAPRRRVSIARMNRDIAAAAAASALVPPSKTRR